MDFGKALPLIQGVFGLEGGEISFNQAELLILKAAWDELTYAEVAHSTDYSAGYLKGPAANKVWSDVSKLFGQKIVKKKFRSFMEMKISQLPRDQLRELLSVDELPRILGDHLPDVSQFYGRAVELGVLRSAVLDQQCISIVGAAGIGKSALVSKLLKEIAEEQQQRFDFDEILWKSMHYDPLVTELVADLQRILNVKKERKQPVEDDIQTEVSQLIDHLRSKRCLIVLDGVNSVHQDEQYKSLIRRICEEQHNSCLLLLSRTPIPIVNKLQALRRPALSLSLKGLEVNDAKEILHVQGISGESNWGEFIEGYQGNPELILLATERIKHFCGGDLERFIDYKTSFASDFIQEILDDHFLNDGQISDIEKQILALLANAPSDNAWVLFSQLIKIFDQKISMAELMKSLEFLEGCSFIESRKDPKTQEICFTIPRSIKKYILQNPTGFKIESAQAKQMESLKG